MASFSKSPPQPVGDGRNAARFTAVGAATCPTVAAAAQENLSRKPEPPAPAAKEAQQDAQPMREATGRDLANAKWRHRGLRPRKHGPEPTRRHCHGDRLLCSTARLVILRWLEGVLVL
ncbi:hypothetical protein E4U53_007680 [Claviceps sorghi]|nr:hypothetical protein E4U53_007680 [Claviceps sorghi]